MKVTLKNDHSYDVKIDDGKMKIYPTPLTENELANVREAAIQMFMKQADFIKKSSEGDEGLTKQLVTINVEQFFDHIGRIADERRTADGSDFSYRVSSYGDSNTDIQMSRQGCVMVEGVEQYEMFPFEQVSIHQSATGYDLDAPRVWCVTFEKYQRVDRTSREVKQVAHLHCYLDNDADAVNRIRNFVNSFCYITKSI
jgi:hypothetical protein